MKFATLMYGMVLFGACVPVAAEQEKSERERNWPQWRGPQGTGVAPQAEPPVKWSEKEGIRWQVALSGRGHSTPIVWGQRVFLTAAIPFGEKLPPRKSGRPGAHDNLAVSQRHQFRVLALRRDNGKTLWSRDLHKELPHEGGHYTGSLASASPVTDGRHLFAFFGSHGLYCLNLDGEVLWKKQLGKMHTKHGHGEGSSPALHGEVLVVNWDHEGESFLAAFDTRTGTERWRRPRNEVTSWATPIIVQHQGRPQVVVCGTARVRGYDLETGNVLWECGGLSANIVATPVAAQGRVFAGSSYEKKAFLGIQLDGAKGDITDQPQVLWRRTRGTPYVPSPLLYGDALYYLGHYQNVLSRIHAPSGKDFPGAFRLGPIRNVYASPVAAAGRVYITDRYGSTIVISHSENPEVLGFNRLPDVFNASAALVGREMFLRGERRLYCLATP